jgi:hypothetical protein
MSAEMLRRAAALMRERAEAATRPVQSPGWIAGREGREFERLNEVYTGPECRDSRDLAVATFAADAQHIASWHPAVALAVADLLDTAPDTGTSSITYHAALAVATAYLGETP